jgi:hypothetical protein
MDMKILFRRKSTKIALLHGPIKYLILSRLIYLMTFACNFVIKNFYGILNISIKLFPSKYILLFFLLLT